MPTLLKAHDSLIQAFAPHFSNCIWQHAQVLVLGAILASDRRTVTAVLRITELSQERQFQTYHRVLCRGVWSSWALSRTLLGLLGRCSCLKGRSSVSSIRRWSADVAPRSKPRAFTAIRCARASRIL
jgi:hypothetical protein